MKKTDKILVSFALIGVFALLNGCIIKYSFTGASIPQAARTFSVAYFPNNAAMVVPTLSNTMTEALRDKFMRQTRLTQIPEEGDFAIEGEITGYVSTPAAVSADEYASMYRLTITVQVRFNNVLEPEWSFTNGKSFSKFADYPADQLLQNVQDGLIEEIVAMLTDDIFNACAANW
jgi:hypothetical protein